MKLILLLAVCLWSVSFIDANRKCYVCSSFNKNESCNDPFNKGISKPEICDLPTAQCVKEKTTALDGGREHFFRGCVSPEYCKTPHSHVYCELCDEDVCNASSTPPYSLLAIPLLFIVKELVY